MRVAVLGAGVAGLVTALRLSQRGYECDVYERWPGLGGQAATLDAGDGVLVSVTVFDDPTAREAAQPLNVRSAAPDSGGARLRKRRAWADRCRR